MSIQNLMPGDPHPGSTMSSASSGSRLGATAVPAPLQLDTLNISSSPHTSHRKQSSVSSISSNGSKTAAFFATSPEQTLPFSLSRQGSTSSATGVNSRYAHLGSFDNLLPLSPTSLERGISIDRGSGLDRAGSRSSTGSARRWVDFEGRPVTPLPSPYGGDARSQQLDYAFPGPQRQASTDSDTSAYVSPPQLHAQGPRRSDGSELGSSDSSTLLSASSSLTAIQLGTPADVLSRSPKTADFFGSNGASSSRSGPANAPTLPSSAALQHNVSLQERRIPSGFSHIDVPSRFPSLVSQPPSPGLSSWNRDAVGEDASTSLQLPGRSDHADGGRHYIVRGSQPIHPSAYVSPPSPDPTEERKGTTMISEGVFAANNVKATRHVHGPSENATGSSILPPIHVLKADGRRLREATSNSEDSALTAIEAPQSDKTARLMSPPEESEDEANGRVGTYKIDRVLGVGAFSKVVLARRVPRRQATATPQDPSGSAQVAAWGEQTSLPGRGVMALKMLEREPCKHNERMRVSWVREVEVLKHVVHPNIVRFMSSFSTHRHHVLVLESVTGGELFDYLARDQAQIAQREWLVRRIFGELANAVGWMHSINLVHRDIKLENIILTHEPCTLQPLTPASLPSGPLVKVSDFGLSRFVDPKSPLLETRCGSEEYAAPELVMGKRYEGRKTDVWALGVVLYALLSGSLPFLPPDDSRGSGHSDGSPQEAQIAHVTRETQSSAMPGRDGNVTQGRLPDARARKSHLLRIAKGDLRWPSHVNDECRDAVSLPTCSPLHRLITPPARLLVAKLLRRDAEKRIAAWDVWNEQWMSSGSITDEVSTGGDSFAPPLDPRSSAGKSWLSANARVHSGASDVVLDD